LYRRIVRAPDGSARADYERFCKLRRDLIASTFDTWTKETITAAAGVYDRRVEAVERMFSPRDHDWIRRMGYPDEVEDALLACVDTGRMKRRRTGNLPGEREVFKAIDRGGRKVFDVHLFRGHLEIEAQPSSPLFERIRSAAGFDGRPRADCPACGEAHASPRCILPTDAAHAEVAGGTLMHLAVELARKES
jgi:hypothetical protein